MRIYTIGHSNHTLEKFVGLLEANGVSMLVDVRSAPASRYNPQFNRASLEAELPRHHIEYAFAGKYLGGRPTDPSCYRRRAIPPEGADYLHEVDYPAVMTRDWFKRGIERMLELASEHCVAIMCSEENPAECHRHHLIARYLADAQADVDVQHIRGDGAVFGAKSLRSSLESEVATQPSLFDP